MAKRHGIALPPRSPQPGLAQDQAHEHPGLRRSWAGRRAREGARARSARCWSARSSTDELRWVGQVGSGFTDRMLTELMAQLEPLVRADPPIDDPALAARQGGDVRRARARLRGPLPGVHEEHGEDARAVVPRHAARRAARRVRAGASRPARGGRRARSSAGDARSLTALRRPAGGTARASRSRDRCPRPTAAPRSRCWRRPRRATAVAIGRSRDLIGHLGDHVDVGVAEREVERRDRAAHVGRQLLDRRPAGSRRPP